MIIVTACGSIPRIYGEAYTDRRFISKSFADMMKFFDKQRADQYYGVMQVRITEIVGASYDDLINNEDWLFNCGYYFTIIETEK